MSFLSQAIYDLVAPLGPAGLVLGIFAIVYIDAVAFPMFPELFLVLLYMGGRPMLPASVLGPLLLVTMIMAELAGITTLYLVVKRLGAPRLIRRAAEKYRDILLIGDERMIFINRFAPVIPYLGAFVALLGWSYRKAILYDLAGCVIKYGLILIFSDYLLSILQGGMADTVIMAMVLTVIAAGLILSLIRKRMHSKKTAKPD